MNSLESIRAKINKIDNSLAELFSLRMEAVVEVAKYKAERAMPIFDASREAEIIARNSALINDRTLVPHYIDFQNNLMRISRSYQVELYPNLSSGIIYDYKGSKRIPVSLLDCSYDIYFGKNLLPRAGELFNLDRRVLVVTDSGVPAEYADELVGACKEATLVRIEAGEASKSIENLELLLRTMAEHHFTRTDCVVAVGGGVVGDLSGFAAASYMRGIDFYNVPTTLLSQVDSSIGGKVAVNLGGFKNIVGAFHQPRAVIVDPSLLVTLPIREVRAGLAEALKVSATSDPTLFRIFESGRYLEELETVIERAILAKRAIVQRDEKEMGERRILNFGHTVGHAIESTTSLVHGEAVAVGMLYACSGEVRQRILDVLWDIGLPTSAKIDDDTLHNFILRDKKADGDTINFVYLERIGEPDIRRIKIKDIHQHIKGAGHGGKL